MKKILLSTVLAVCIASPAKAFTSCEGGTIVYANQYTDANAPAGCDATKCPAIRKRYCKSTSGMTWWSALTWCDAQGGNLATFTGMCPGAAPAINNVDGACPALQGITETSQWAWSGYPVGANNALGVSLLSGAVVNINRNTYYIAFCE